MKNVLILYLIAIGITLNAVDGHSILKQALDAGKTISFSASLDNPFPPAGRDKDILPYAPQWKFHRLNRDGVLYLRLDTLDKKKVIETYLKNADGIYGQSSDGFAAQIIEVPELWYPDLNHLAINEEEMKVSAFSIQMVSYQGTQCYKVVMKTPQGSDLLMKITGDSKEEFEENRKRYLEKRVFVREFLINRDNHFIHSRKHYNRDGNLIFKVEFKELAFHPSPNPDLFQTPEGIRGQLLTRDYFASRALDQMLALRKPSMWSKLEDSLSRNFDWISYYLKWTLAGVGVLCIAAVFVLKTRKG